MTGGPGPTNDDGKLAVELRFTMAASEVKEALRDMAVRRRSVLGIAVLGVAGITFGIVAIVISAGNAVLSVVLIALGAYIFSYVLWQMPARAIRRSPRLLAEKTMIFSESGVGVRSSAGESKAPWSAFVASYETDKFYLLRLRQKWGCYIVPKRAFEASEVQSEFRKLLLQHTQAHLR